MTFEKLRAAYFYDRDAEMAEERSRRTTSEAPKSAANFVRRSAAAIRSGDASISRGRAEFLALVEFARVRKRLVDSGFLDRFSYKGYGAEHRVYYDEASNCAIKVTHPNRFGHSTYGPGVGATPYEYLMRLAWANSLLGDDFRIMGIIYDEEQLQVVTSQPWIVGARGQEHPTPREIDAYFAKLGFVRLAAASDAPLYYRQVSDLLIADATDFNIVRDNEGQLFAIDVVVGTPGPYVRKLIGSG